MTIPPAPDRPSMAQDSLRAAIRADIAHYALRDGEHIRAAFLLRLFLLTPGFQFVFARRMQDALGRIPVVGRPARRVWWWWTCRRFGAELAMDASFGGGLYIPHPYGIVVGVCRVGRNVTILQNVTIGTRTPHDVGRAEIGDGAYLAAGSVILGPIRIGTDSRIAANAVVLHDVMDRSTAAGVPARIVSDVKLS